MKKKKFILALLYICIHAAFFTHLYLSSGINYYLFGFFLLPAYFILPFHTEKINLNSVIVNTIYFGIGMYTTQLLQFYFSPVLSACIPPIVLILIEFVIKTKLNEIEAAVYSGCFAGMTLLHWFEDYQFLTLLSCIIGGTMLTVFNKSMNGFGGKLGSIGFASVILWLFIK